MYRCVPVFNENWHRRPIISGLLYWFSSSFHQIVDIESQMVDLTVFFRSLKRRCHGNQFWGKISDLRRLWQWFRYIVHKFGVSFNTIEQVNEWMNQWINEWMNSFGWRSTTNWNITTPMHCDDLSTSCKNLANFHPVPPGFMRLN